MNKKNIPGHFGILSNDTTIQFHLLLYHILSEIASLITQ